MHRLSAAVLLALALGASAETRIEQNEALARRVFAEVLTGGDFELAGRLYAPDFVNHGRNADIPLARDQEAARGWLVAFPDLRVEPELVLAEKDLVAVLWRASGTHRGAANGLPAATGRRMNSRGITIWRIVDGRLKEEWSEFSQLHVLRQLGLAPGMPALDAPHAVTPRAIAAQPSTDEERERNRALVMSVFQDAVGKGKLELFETIYAQAFVNHGIERDGDIDGEIRATRGMREMAPDLRVNVVLSVAEGDLVAVVYTADGTNTGEGLGYPASGRRLRVRGMSILRVADGKIAEEWSVLDQHQLLDASTPPKMK